jgi:hypothetical protein
VKIGEMWYSVCKSGAFLGPIYSSAIARHYPHSMSHFLRVREGEDRPWEEK